MTFKTIREEIRSWREIIKRKLIERLKRWLLEQWEKKKEARERVDKKLIMRSVRTLLEQWEVKKEPRREH